VCVCARVCACVCACRFCFLKCSVIEHMTSTTATSETGIKRNSVQENLTKIKKMDANSYVHSLNMRHSIQRVFKWTACMGKENGKIWTGRTLYKELFWQNCALYCTIYTCKEYVVWGSRGCQIHKKENVLVLKGNH
jgi:hypothetical protein